MLVDDDLSHGNELVVEASRSVRRRPALLRAERERVLILPGHRERSATFSPVSPIDSSGNISSSRGFGKRQPSVVSHTVWLPRGNAASGFAMTSGARLIDSTPPATTISASPASTAWEAETTAESPDAQSRFSVTPATESGRPGEERCHPRDVPVVLPGLVRAAEVDVFDRVAVDPGSLDRSCDRDSGEVVRPNAREHAAVPPDRRAHR